MKQYIPRIIVNSELTDVQRSTLKHSLESFKGWDGSFIRYPGLSVGQMIEFLGINIDEIDNEGTNWKIITDRHYNPTFYKKIELCDALWEAVKEILNER